MFDEMIGAILDNVSPRDLIRFSQTCLGARNAVQKYMRQAFNIHSHLFRFFKAPQEFRALQARTGTLISGSSALQFMDRSFYKESDLDLYVDRRYGREIGLWLMGQGYEYYKDQDFDKEYTEYA